MFLKRKQVRALVEVKTNVKQRSTALVYIFFIR